MVFGGYLCVGCNTHYIEISPKVWECPICKKRYHEFGYDEEYKNKPTFGDYSNLNIARSL